MLISSKNMETLEYLLDNIIGQNDVIKNSDNKIIDNMNNYKDY